MAIARYRTKGPIYHQPHKIGQWFLRSYVGGQYVYVPSTFTYCTGSSTFYNMWIAEQKECWDETHPGPPWRDGGPLFIKEWISPRDHVHFGTYTSPGKGSYQYRGGFCHNHPYSDSEYPNLGADESLANTWGATGWNRFRPVKSGADLGQFIGELRDFKSLFRFRLRSFKDLGSSYLNFQFGWKPFVNDIRKFYESMQKVERTIDFIRRNNNRWIKRGGTLKTNTETGNEYEVGCKVMPLLNTYYHLVFPISQSPTKVVPVESERIWYKARMKYFIPDLHIDRCEDVLTSALLRRIYGLELTPSLMWELTPWSWLADWFGNVGDILANLSSASYDNLVAKYAYVMRSWERIVFYNTVYKFSTKELGNTSIKISSSFVLRTKQRSEANSPYGFHLGWGDLSPYQLSILAALGLSRS